APEQVDPRGFGGVDWRTDVYQLGCVLYEMVAGRPPISGGETPAIIYNVLNEAPAPIGGVSRELEEFIFKALSKKKEGRFGSVDVMLYELEKLV
ncbi:MAG: hypothetical protein QXR19_15815, partial [Candidatus Jordarchaeaceae archaeon]